VDGTFTKTQFIQTLLLAVGINADNHAVLLAWGLVESETEDSWRFFLINLKFAMPVVDSSHVTLMSDWDKELAAARTELPETKQANCIQHLAENVSNPTSIEKKPGTSLTLLHAHSPRMSIWLICNGYSNTEPLQLSMSTLWIEQHIVHPSSPAEPMDIIP